jgi:conjugative transfer pilus assembly protein TraH
MGLESDRDAARRRCATDRTSILASARTSGDANVRNKAPFVGNLTWKALQRTGTYLDDQERELIMSMVGTVIFYPEDAARDPEPVAPTITSISHLLYGQAAGAGTNVTQHLLRCNDYTNCDVVTLNTAYTHTPFTARVETMMRSIADKIATRTADPQQLARGRLRQPDHRAGLQDAVDRRDHPGLGPVGQPDRPVPRRDRRRLRLRLPGAQPARRHGGAGQGLHLQQTPARTGQPGPAARPGHAAATAAQEKNLLYQKVGSFRAVSSHLEQLERQLRSSMPQHVMDMLGQQAAYLSR